MRASRAALGVVILLCVCGAVPAQAQMPDWRARAGIEKAKGAGMRIDPAAEEAMARAPVGSCPNDPTQARCPKAEAVVASGVEATDGSVYYGPGTPAAASRRTTARTAQISQCAVKVSDASPYKASGYAQMNASNICYASVTRHELYGVLRKYYAGQWYAMASRGTSGIGGQTIRVHVTFNCTATPYRPWQALADAYALLRGIWYAATQSKFNNLYCG